MERYKYRSIHIELKGRVSHTRDSSALVGPGRVPGRSATLGDKAYPQSPQEPRAYQPLRLARIFSGPGTPPGQATDLGGATRSGGILAGVGKHGGRQQNQSFSL